MMCSQMTHCLLILSLLQSDDHVSGWRGNVRLGNNSFKYHHNSYFQQSLSSCAWGELQNISWETLLLLLLHTHHCIDNSQEFCFAACLFVVVASQEYFLHFTSLHSLHHVWIMYVEEDLGDTIELEIIFLLHFLD